MESWLAFLVVTFVVPQLLSFDTLKAMLSGAGLVLSADLVFHIQVEVTMVIAILISLLVV